IAATKVRSVGRHVTEYVGSTEACTNPRSVTESGLERASYWLGATTTASSESPSAPTTVTKAPPLSAVVPVALLWAPGATPASGLPGSLVASIATRKGLGCASSGIGRAHAAVAAQRSKRSGRGLTPDRASELRTSAPRATERSERRGAARGAPRTRPAQ